ncbi:hypothetical protein LINPERHAP2_LOCUS6017 [Linum perenne]
MLMPSTQKLKSSSTTKEGMLMPSTQKVQKKKHKKKEIFRDKSGRFI